MERLPGRSLTAVAVVMLAVALGFGVAACGGTAAVATPVGPLVTVEVHGGLCASAPCGTTIYVERDGRVHQAAKPPNDLGTVPPVALAGLTAAINATDFTAVKRHLFSGQCPTAADGQEYVFEFAAPSGAQRIASCEVAIDFGSPLFVAVSTALGPFVPLPTT